MQCIWVDVSLRLATRGKKMQILYMNLYSKVCTFDEELLWRWTKSSDIDWSMLSMPVGAGSSVTRRWAVLIRLLINAFVTSSWADRSLYTEQTAVYILSLHILCTKLTYSIDLQTKQIVYATYSIFNTQKTASCILNRQHLAYSADSILHTLQTASCILCRRRLAYSTDFILHAQQTSCILCRQQPHTEQTPASYSSCSILVYLKLGSLLR